MGTFTSKRTHPSLLLCLVVSTYTNVPHSGLLFSSFLHRDGMFLADVLVAIVSSRYPSKPYVLSTNPCNRMLINIFVIHMCCIVVPEKKSRVPVEKARYG